MSTNGMTNVTTTAPAVPAWLNLDAILDPKIRAEIAELVAEGTELAEQVDDWCRRAYAIKVAHERGIREATSDVRVDLDDLVSQLTGFEALWDVAQRMTDASGVITDSVGNPPAWLAPFLAAAEGLDGVDPSRVGKA